MRELPIFLNMLPFECIYSMYTHTQRCKMAPMMDDHDGSYAYVQMHTVCHASSCIQANSTWVTTTLSCLGSHWFTGLSNLRLQFKKAGINSEREREGFAQKKCISHKVPMCHFNDLLSFLRIRSQQTHEWSPSLQFCLTTHTLEHLQYTFLDFCTKKKRLVTYKPPLSDNEFIFFAIDSFAEWVVMFTLFLRRYPIPSHQPEIPKMYRYPLKA